jgi:hypothetical protein
VAIKEADAKKLVKWILTLAPSKGVKRAAVAAKDCML